MKSKDNALISMLAAAVVASSGFSAYARENGNVQEQETWTLERCIEYALENSTEITKGEIDVEKGRIAVQSAWMQRLPDLSASVGGNTYFGRGPSRDGTYVDNSQFSTSFGVGASVPVFNGMRILHEERRAKIELESAALGLELARNNIEMQITSLYLQLMYSIEMLNVSEYTVSASRSEAERNRVKMEQGKISKSVYVESQSILARDEASVIRNRNAVMMSELDLKQAMNLHDAEPLRISASFGEGDLPLMSDLPSLDEICAVSLSSHPSVLIAESNLRSMETSLKVAKSAYYPSLNLSAGYGNSFYRNLTDNTANMPFWDQLKYNGNEYVSLSLNIPVFMRNSVRNNVRTAKLAVESGKVALTETEKTLRKEIEQAYYGACAAFSDMKAAEKAFESAEMSFMNEQAKMDAGASSIYDYAAAKASMDSARAQYSHSKYDYLLKYRILLFYMDM